MAIERPRQEVRRRSVLLVDDDPNARATLSAVLAERGYDVRESFDGRDALEALRRGATPDVIVLDLMMPVMDGWEFRVEQKRDPSFARIPVMALSADPTPKAAAIDADAYLSKPIDCDTFIAAIERLMVQVERREMQEKLAQNDRLSALGTLSAGVAHEINNPLAFVLINIGFLGDNVVLLGQARDDAARAHLLERVRQDLEQVRLGAERIRDIVRGLKTFSRPESDRRALLDLRAVVDAAITMVQNEIRHRARLVKVYDDEVPQVLGNESSLGQVFLNLLINAAQALPSDDPSRHEIRVVIRSVRERVTVEVHDTGVGIPPEILGRVFEPFFTTKPVGTGTGLGLAICYGTIAEHGGSIAVESQPGEGSCFRVQLPVAQAAERGPSHSGTRPAVRLHRCRVLIVDDEPAFCSGLQRILRDEHDVVAVHDAREAWRRIEAGERFDFVLCDVMMPEMNGEQLYRAVHGVDPEQAEGFVFLTGGAFTEATQRFLADVPNPRLEKPFPPEDLRDVLRAGRFNEDAKAKEGG